MAYQPQNLSALSYSNGFTLWHYRSTDAAAVIDTAGYFNPAAAMLRAGDFVFVNAGIEETPTHGVMVITSNNGTRVDASNLAAFATVNTD